MIYIFPCLDCHKIIREQHGEGTHKMYLPAAICRACTRVAVDFYIEENTMESNLVKDLMERDGEHLSGALADAERKAREFRQKASGYLAEAEKWEQIANQLRAVADLARRPAAEIKLPQASAVQKTAAGRRPQRRHGFWPEAIATALRGWNATNSLGRGPTKRELAKELVGSAQVTEKEAMLAINHAVTMGRLSYRVDHLYLPGTTAHAAAD